MTRSVPLAGISLRARTPRARSLAKKLIAERDTLFLPVLEAPVEDKSPPRKVPASNAQSLKFSGEGGWKSSKGVVVGEDDGKSTRVFLLSKGDMPKNYDVEFNLKVEGAGDRLELLLHKVARDTTVKVKFASNGASVAQFPQGKGLAPLKPDQSDKSLFGFGGDHRIRVKVRESKITVLIDDKPAFAGTAGLTKGQLGFNVIGVKATIANFTVFDEAGRVLSAGMSWN